MSANCVVDGLIEELIDHLHEHDLSEELRRVLQIFVMTQELPEIFLHQHDAPYQLTHRHAFFRALGANLGVTVLNIRFRLGDEPLPEVRVDATDELFEFRGVDALILVAAS